MNIRCGGIFSDYFITRFTNFENRSIFGELSTNLLVYFFDSQCIIGTVGQRPVYDKAIKTYQRLEERAQ